MAKPKQKTKPISYIAISDAIVKTDMNSDIRINYIGTGIVRIKSSGHRLVLNCSHSQ